MAKYCFNCGSEIEADWNVCPGCGAKLKEDEFDQEFQTQQLGRPQPQPYQPPTHYPQQPQSYHSQYQGYTKRGTGYTYGIISIICSIVGCCCFFGLPLGIAAVILGALGTKRDEQATLSVIGIIIGLISILCSITLMALYGLGYIFY